MIRQKAKVPLKQTVQNVEKEYHIRMSCLPVDYPGQNHLWLVPEKQPPISSLGFLYWILDWTLQYPLYNSFHLETHRHMQESFHHIVQVHRCLLHVSYREIQRTYQNEHKYARHTLRRLFSYCRPLIHIYSVPDKDNRLKAKKALIIFVS